MSGDFKGDPTLVGKLLASGSVNPAYKVNFIGVPTGGTFTITLTTGIGGSSPNSQTTANITYAAGLTAAAVQTAIQALTGMSTVTVSGSNGGPFTITIPDALGVSTVTAANVGLTGGTNPSISVTMTGNSTAIYTVPNASAAKVTAGWICAASGQGGLLSVAVVPSGGSQDGTHHVLASYSLQGGDTVSIQDALVALRDAMLDAGAKVYVICAAPVTFGLSGAVSA